MFALQRGLTVLGILIVVACVGSAQTTASQKKQPQTSSAKQEAYRDIGKADGITFTFHGALFNTPVSGGPPSGQFFEFGLVDATGKFIKVEVVSQSFFEGHIKTKLFGDILVSASETYSATETQIKKIHDFLAKQGK
jgi:hypothetical protein